ncbi:MAG: Ig-like domain-containing protein [Bacteroidia bacterium]
MAPFKNIRSIMRARVRACAQVVRRLKSSDHLSRLTTIDKSLNFVRRNMAFSFQSAFFLSALVFILGACAQPGSPDGGPVDKTGPTVVKTTPEVGSVNIREAKLVIEFDEYVKKPAYDKEILISPFLKSRPKVKLNGKKVIIKFTEPLDLGVTYVVTLIDVKDFNNSNKMETPFQLAFSTGATIDSMEIEGKVENALGEGASEITILLFDADSVSAETLPNKRPAYITKTNKSGTFSLGYLRPGPFEIYGIRDGNGSRSYTPPSEAIALAEQPEIAFDTSGKAQVTLFVSTPDAQAPLVNNVQWLTDSSMLIGFTEGLITELVTITMSDTAGADESTIEDWVYLGDEIALSTSRKRENFSLLTFSGLTDSLRNKADTTLSLRPRRARLPESDLLSAPTLDPNGPSYTWVTPFGLPATSDTAVRLRLMDTTLSLVPIQVNIDGLSGTLSSDTALAVSSPYVIEMPGRWWGDEDSVYSFGIKVFDPEGYGMLQGRVQIGDTSGYEGAYIIRLIGPETIVLGDTLFDLKLLTPGSYKSQVIFDSDNNGVWTPGSLIPYRLPERILNGESVDVRANWEFEDYVIKVGVKKAVQPDSTSGGN